jgi:mannose-1-phosphate guanylyltransferase
VITHALVLTAGLGTRLRPLTDVRAKPAIPVAGEPMIRRIISWLAAHGVTDLVLNLHHRPETLTAVVGDGADLSVRVRYSWEPRILGSAGGPRQALPLVAADPFLIVNGDTIADVDLAMLSVAHDTSNAIVTLALVPNHEFRRYGGVLLDPEGRITGFVNRGPSAEGSYHYIGVQVVQAAAFDAVPQGEAARSIGGVYDTLMRQQPGSVRGFVSDAEFWDVGTIEDYWRTSTALAIRSDMADLGVGRGCHVDRSARIARSILWDDVHVGAEAVIEDCILTDGVHVEAGAVHRGEILIRS